ncbi:MAG TPA: GNAT family N-acetyltransferase [Paucimonas sp.]|nr:GNAT family N-acetyltransferase [Paucimonas sp.]
MESKNLLLHSAPLADPATVVRQDLDGVTIECHRQGIPADIEPELEALYGSLFSSLAHFRVYGGAENASTYVARAGGKAIAIFLFRIEGGTVRVVNEWMPLDDAEAGRFARYIFASHPSVGAIVFGAVAATLSRPGFPCQRVDITEDSVLTLPASGEAFAEMLGKSTRTNIRYYLNKLKKDFPSFRFTVYRGSEADEDDMRNIVLLNRVRMRNKRKVSANGDAALEKILRLAHAAGLVGVATVDGRLCAGVIGYRIGDHFFSWVRAHDPAFDGYRLGRLTAYLMIGEAIARGVREYHFMWGREEHKALLQGVERRFHRVILYRSRRHLLRHAPTALRALYDGRVRRLRLWLQDASRRDDRVSRLATRTLDVARRLKHWLAER